MAESEGNIVGPWVRKENPLGIQEDAWKFYREYKAIDPGEIDLEAHRKSETFLEERGFISYILVPVISAAGRRDRQWARGLAEHCYRTYPGQLNLWAAYINLFRGDEVKDAISSLPPGGEDADGNKIASHITQAAKKIPKRSSRHAINLLDIAIEAYGLRPDYATQKSSILLRMRRPIEARAVIDNALAKFPEDPAVHRQNAILCQGLKDYEGAIRSLECVLKQEPDNYKSRTMLGMIFYQNDRAHDAINQFKHVKAQQPEDKIARYMLAMSHFVYGSPQEATVELNAMLDKGFDYLAMKIYRQIVMAERDATYSEPYERRLQEANSAGLLDTGHYRKLAIRPEQLHVVQKPKELLDRIFGEVMMQTHSGRLFAGEKVYAPASRQDAKASSSGGSGHQDFAEMHSAKHSQPTRAPVRVRANVGRR